MNFSKEEYKSRLKKVQSSMQEKGIELLISHDTANMNYLTGYDAWSFYYAQAVIVHINAEEPLCWVRKQDSGGAYIKTYLKKENVLVYDEKYIHTWPLHPYQYLVEIIKEKKWDRSNIGLEMDSHYFTAFCYETIKTGLPNAKFKDAERLVNWVRVIKSDAEIKLMQAAARISELGMKTAFDIINPADYTSSWADRSNEEARELGYISAYASSQPREDFVEMIAYMLIRSATKWDALVDGIASPLARASIRQKEQLIVEYYQEKFNINFYELRELTYQALLEI